MCGSNVAAVHNTDAQIPEGWYVFTCNEESAGAYLKRSIQICLGRFSKELHKSCQNWCLLSVIIPKVRSVVITVTGINLIQGVYSLCVWSWYITHKH